MMDGVEWMFQIEQITYSVMNRLRTAIREAGTTVYRTALSTTKSNQVFSNVDAEDSLIQINRSILFGLHETILILEALIPVFYLTSRLLACEHQALKSSNERLTWLDGQSQLDVVVSTGQEERVDGVSSLDRESFKEWALVVFDTLGHGRRRRVT